MDDEPVDFLLEMVLHLPRPADLDRCQEILQRIFLSDASAERHAGVSRALTCLVHFPEGTATGYVLLSTETQGVPSHWQPPPGVPALVAYAPCHRVPRIRAEDFAVAICHLFIEIANVTHASAGYVDVAGRQEREPAPTPWASVQPPPGAVRRLLGQKPLRVAMHRDAPFPDGLVEGALGFPPKPRPKVAACIVVAGVAVEDADRPKLGRAADEGLCVWRVPLVGGAERTLVGILVAQLALAESRVEMAPSDVVDAIRRASAGLARLGLRDGAGLLMARVEDAEAA